tara:strand:- start:159 stop:827 length:669 start_codon:yes stop_codon:yes gene_type:complete
MTLWLHVHGGYPSYARNCEEWTPTDHTALKFVRALKGQEFNGYATLRTRKGEAVQIRKNHTAPAFRIFGEWAAHKLGELQVAGGFLVPVPSSSCTAFGTDEKGRNLATAVADRNPNFKVGEALSWKVDLGRAAEGGPRDSGTLFNNLNVKPHAEASTVVLIDDVASSGGHLLACARALRLQGHTVEHALCAARTVNTHPANMWAIPPCDLEANPFENLPFNF